MTERDRDDRERTTNDAAQRTGAEGEERTARDQGDGFGQKRGQSGEMSRSATGGTTGDDDVSARGGTGGYGSGSGYSSGSEALNEGLDTSSRRDQRAQREQREPDAREQSPIDEERFDTRALGTREPPGEMPDGEQVRDEGGARETE